MIRRQRDHHVLIETGSDGEKIVLLGGRTDEGDIQPPFAQACQQRRRVALFGRKYDVGMRRSVGAHDGRDSGVEIGRSREAQPQTAAVSPLMTSCFGHRILEARKLMKEAGYPGGKDFPEITLLYNTSESHKKIAEFIQRNLKENLGVTIELANMEWKVFLEERGNQNFELARGAWCGDYNEASTFLDLLDSASGYNDGKYAKCVCPEGFQGPDCDIPVCVPTCPSPYQCTTSGCVRASAVDSLQCGYHTVVVRDGVGDRADGPHEANLFDIDAKYGDVVPMSDVLEYLGSLGSGNGHSERAVEEFQRWWNQGSSVHG